MVQNISAVCVCVCVCVCVQSTHPKEPLLTLTLTIKTLTPGLFACVFYLVFYYHYSTQHRSQGTKHFGLVCVAKTIAPSFDLECTLLCIGQGLVAETRQSKTKSWLYMPGDRINSAEDSVCAAECLYNIHQEPLLTLTIKTLHSVN